jgi:hypothetical protein
MRPVNRSGPTRPDPLCQLLHKVLVNWAQTGKVTTGGVGSIEWRAVITLYSLLRDHPIDQWERCRSCRWPGSILGPRWRPCQIYAKATLCLHQLDEVLLLDLLAED